MAEHDRLVTSDHHPRDVREFSLRPSRLDAFIGQSKLKRNLQIFMDAAKKRGEFIDHVLMYGPPGLGKTTLANILANEMGVNIKTTSGPAIERTGDLAAILTNLQEGDVLFIDEIHRINRSIEEILYPALEDFALDIVIGKGPSARSIRLDVSRFTLVGATTKAGMLSAPLRDRFGIVEQFEFYQPSDLIQIVQRTSHILDTPIEDDAALEIAKRSRGTPRIANRILKRVRDWAQIQSDGTISCLVVEDALRAFEIDQLGLDRTDCNYLRCIIEKFRGGPVGLDTLSASISEESDTIEDVYEPFLLQLGFIKRTPRGRVATPASYHHLGISYPEEASTPDECQKTLFAIEPTATS